MSRAIVVGAGIAGIACARVLADGGVSVSVRERGRSVGGRMASQPLGARTADTGAQYATTTGSAFTAVMDDWVSRGVARPWAEGFHTWAEGVLSAPHAGAMRFAAPGGIRSLAADLSVGLDVTTSAEVHAVAPGPLVDGEPADAVVLAMPDAQALRLLDPALADTVHQLSTPVWEPVLALTAQWNEPAWPDGLDGVFVNGDPVLSWIADDGRRRGDGAAVLVAHSTGAFAAERLADPDAAVPELLAAVSRVLGFRAPPVATRVQRWGLARPGAPREQRYHLGTGMVGLCGDGWGAAKVETAWVSGHELGAALLARLA